MNLRPHGPGNRQMFPGCQNELGSLHGEYLVHIDDAIPVAAYELGVYKEHTGKIFKPHVSADRLIWKMDLYVVV